MQDTFHKNYTEPETEYRIDGQQVKPKKDDGSTGYTPTGYQPDGAAREKELRQEQKDEPLNPFKQGEEKQ